MSRIMDNEGNLLDVNGNPVDGPDEDAEDEEDTSTTVDTEDEDLEDEEESVEDQDDDEEEEDSDEDDSEDSDEDDEDESGSGEGESEDDEFGDMSEEDIEAEARSQGWVPPEEYRGDPKRAVDAKEFLRRGKEILPIVQSQLQRERKQLEEVKKQLQNLTRVTRESEKRRFEKFKEELLDKRNEARSMQDWDDVDEVEEKLKEVNSKLEEFEKADKHEEQPSPEEIIRQVREAPETQEFLEKNSWYEKDQRLTKYADMIGPRIRQSNPNMSMKEYYDALSKEVRDMFPERFKSTGRKRPKSAASSTGRGSDRVRGNSNPTNGKTFNDLPKEAKAVFKEEKAEGLWKNKQEFVDVYFANEE